MTQGTQSLRGKRVEIEDIGSGAIIDVTETLVGILLDGDGCRVMYVPISALIPSEAIGL